MEILLLKRQDGANPINFVARKRNHLRTHKCSKFTICAKISHKHLIVDESTKSRSQIADERKAVERQDLCGSAL